MSLLRHPLRLVVAGLLLGASAGSVVAQTPGPAPVRGPSIEGITEYRLGNGLRVLLFPDRSKPQTTVNVTYLVGSRFEGYGETGMAHLLEHMQFKGTPRHRAPSEEITAHGAQFDATTSFDRTNFFETFPAADSNLVWALDLEADRMVNSFIARADLEKEFPVVRNEFESGENNAFLVTLKRVLGSAYLFHAYGHLPIGARSDIENVSIERLQAFYHKYYQPDNAILMIAGNFDEQRALALVQEKFGAIPRPSRLLEPTYTVEPTQDGEREVTVRRTGDEQLVMAYYHLPSGRHPDFPAIDVLTRVLGDPASGRLFQALVTTKNAAAVQANNLQQYDPAGLFIAARVRKDQSIDSAETALLRAADEVATTRPPTAEEVERAKQAVLKGFELAPTNTGTFGLQLSEWMGMGDWRLFFYYRDRVKAVTAPDVQRVARAYLKSSNMTIGRFIPTASPDRVEIAAAPSADSLLRNYQSSEIVAAGEAFDPSPANIESRVKRRTLPSGMRVALLEKRNRGAAVSAVISVHLGSEQSLTNRAATAALTAQMLMRGTTSLSRQQLRDSLDHLEARVAVTAPTANNVRVTIETTRPNFPAVLRLVADVLHQPAFAATELEQVQRETLAMVEGQRGDPQTLALSTLARTVTAYPKGNPRYVPTADEQIETLKAVTLDQVKDFHSQFYGASSAELVVVGDFDPAAVNAIADRAFGHWRTASAYRPIPARLAPAVARRQTLETPDKPNAFFAAAETFPMRDTDRDFAAMMLANYLLGEAPLDSRLPNRIRVKEGLSYAVQSVLNVSSYEKAGQWLALAIYNPLNGGKVSAAFFDELGKVAKVGFTPAEVEQGKSAFLQRRTLARANDMQLALQIANELPLNRTMRFDEALEKQIAALTPDEVNAAVRRTLDPSKMTVVMAGDFAKVQQAGEPKK